MRQKYLAGAIDGILPGAISDEWRIWRYMHASHAAENDGELFRYAGNTVFPNGELHMKLLSAPGAEILDFYGESSAAAKFALQLNGKEFELEFDENNHASIPLKNYSGELQLVLRKSGSSADFPAFKAVCVR
jgi:hypothetical protein